MINLSWTQKRWLMIVVLVGSLFLSFGWFADFFNYKLLDKVYVKYILGILVIQQLYFIRQDLF